jgi:superfamily II DNA/RNA helicase
MRENSFTVFTLHLGMTDTQRCGIVKDFMASRLLPKTVLVTTDLWFCGQPAFLVQERLQDLCYLQLTINYDLPCFPQLYIHRIGAYFHP